MVNIVDVFGATSDNGRGSVRYRTCEVSEILVTGVSAGLGVETARLPSRARRSQ